MRLVQKGNCALPGVDKLTLAAIGCKDYFYGVRSAYRNSVIAVHEVKAIILIEKCTYIISAF